MNFSASENAVRASPPILGQHTAQVLTDVLNLSQEEIRSLKKTGAIDFPEDDNVLKERN